MATNTDRPNGFTPVGHKGGGTVRAAEFEILYSYATAVYSGDAVILSSGYVNQAAQDSASVLGVFAGCQYVDNSGNVIFSPYWPGVALTDSGKKVKAFVYVDPDILYEVQTDTGTTSTIASVGVAYDIELDHSGSATTGRSGMELDISDTGTGQFTIYGLADRPDNAWGINAKVIVFNNVPTMG
jgi:hypothetical protein